MKKSELLLVLRSNNLVVLAGGFFLVLIGVFAALILGATNWWNLTLILLGLAVLGLFLAANLAEVKAVGKKRSTVVQANLALVALAMLGIVGGLNYVMSRHPVRFDMTSNKFFTLSDQTLEALGKLNQDVNVTFFVTSKQRTPPDVQRGVQRAIQLLTEYSKKSTKFHFKTIDGDQKPGEVQRLQVHAYNTIVFESGNNRKDVLQGDYLTYSPMTRQSKFQGEGIFTSALMKMSDTTHLTIYFTEGHGEKEYGSPRPDGFNIFKDLLEKQNYTIKNVNLLSSGKVPEDAAVLAVIGPSKTFPSFEEKLIKDYLLKGGKLVLCLDPTLKSGLDSLLKEFGIKLGDDYAVDPTKFATDIRIIIPQCNPHPIVDKLVDDHIDAFIPFCRSVKKTEPVLKNVTQTIFLQTTEKGWGETDLKAKKPEYASGVDTKGPLPLAMACEWLPSVESPSKKTRVVVFGGSNFLTNQFLTGFLAGPGNLDIALNSFSWAAVEENKITIHPKEEDNRVLNLTNVSSKVIFYTVVVILPLAALAAGILIWYRRRSL